MHKCLLPLLTVVLLLARIGTASAAPPGELLPKHIDGKTVQSINRGLEFLVEKQAANGSWQTMTDGSTYPVTMTSLAGMALLANGNTTSRGPHADTVKKAVRYVMSQSTPSGLIAAGSENGRPMYGHGFSMLFLATAYGMETDPRARARIEKTVTKAIQLTARGQSGLGGWTYTPGGGDEGSVTVTQMQGLRAAHNAGFTVPKATIEGAIRYLEACRTSEGGIRYSYGSGDDSRLPISAAAIACLYSAGEYDSPLADRCLNYVYKKYDSGRGQFRQSGHSFYLHFYASQAFYQAGDEYWDKYFPSTRDFIIKQQAGDGSWNGDGVGSVFGTSVALIILQLPYKYLPIYQR